MKKAYLFLFLSLAMHSTFASPRMPKLIVVISVDQFRADYLRRFEHLFLPTSKSKPGGFRYLMENGSYFSHAEFGILQNMTGPGHATILTGSFPYQNGIPGNDWRNTETGEFVYCTEDSAHKTIGNSQNNPHSGTSPKNLIGTTVGDELKSAYPKSKVVSLALKDRAAILLGGHRSDLALWFDPSIFQWVSSSYYVPELPQWVRDINASLLKESGTKISWEATKVAKKNPLLDPNNKYLKEVGVAFPHSTTVGSPASMMFPLAVDLPVQLAKKAISEFDLGQDSTTDLLAMSFSNHDYVGHSFGSESSELKEITLVEDRKLAELFNYLDEKIPGGLSETWIVLTADHGVADTTEVLQKNKVPAGRIDQAPMVAAFESYLRRKYGAPKSGPWMLEPSELNFFISERALKEKKLTAAKVQAELVEHIRTKKQILSGISHVFSGVDVRMKTLPPGLHESQILRTYFPGRSGDVMMIPLPNFVVSYGTATHMSGYSYDRYVPMIFAGKPFKTGLIPGGNIVDIAPTLSFLLGIIPPSNSEGKILSSALRE